MTPVRLEPAAPRSRVSTVELIIYIDYIPPQMTLLTLNRVSSILIHYLTLPLKDKGKYTTLCLRPSAASCIKQLATQ